MPQAFVGSLTVNKCCRKNTRKNVEKLKYVWLLEIMQSWTFSYRSLVCDFDNRLYYCCNVDFKRPEREIVPDDPTEPNYQPSFLPSAGSFFEIEIQIWQLIQIVCR